MISITNNKFHTRTDVDPLKPNDASSSKNSSFTSQDISSYPHSLNNAPTNNGAPKRQPMNNISLIPIGLTNNASNQQWTNMPTNNRAPKWLSMKNTPLISQPINNAPLINTPPNTALVQPNAQRSQSTLSQNPHWCNQPMHNASNQHSPKNHISQPTIARRPQSTLGTYNTSLANAHTHAPQWRSD